MVLAVAIIAWYLPKKVEGPLENVLKPA